MNSRRRIRRATAKQMDTRKETQTKMTRSNRLPPRLAAALVSALGAAALLAGVGVPSAAADFGINPGEFQGFVSTTQAGAYPDATASFRFKTGFSPGGKERLEGNPRNATVEIPAGLIGNPQAAPKCKQNEFTAISPITGFTMCPTNSQVGTADVEIALNGNNNTTDTYAVYNLVPPFGQPAQFGFMARASLPIIVNAYLRQDGDYGVTTSAINIPAVYAVFGSTVTLWGVPGDPSHDALRCPTIFGGGEKICKAPFEPTPATSDLRPFITNQTHCTVDPLITTIFVDSWQEPENLLRYDDESPPVTGCAAVPFDPSISVNPTSTTTDTPSGLKVDVSVPQTTDPSVLATSDLKDAAVTLPKGVAISPGAVDGLIGCTDAEFGEHTGVAGKCPNASKIGTAEVITPLLEHALVGNVFVRQPDIGADINHLFQIFVEIEDEETGVNVKLHGMVLPDPQTGQLTTKFLDNPQLPFTHFILDLNKSGARAPLTNPPVCGTYTTTTALTPWTENPDATPSSSFVADQTPVGGVCPTDLAQRPLTPAINAGNQSSKAGIASPFSFKLTRPDGNQDLSSLDLTMPPGFSAILKGVPYCPEAAIAAIAARTGKAEIASPSCPAASRIGTVTTGVGAGAAPLYVGGQIYLTGPREGAPLSLAVVTPAVTGPFDFGNVVVRALLNVDRQTAQTSVKSDPIPQILEGVPLRVRSIAVNIDRPNFTINPTNCNQGAVTAAAHGTNGAIAGASSPFQATGCNSLNFKPKFTAKVTGGTKRGDHPALTATLTYPEGSGNANIKDVQVALPHSEFLDQAHINTVCTRVQAAAHQCPAGSIYGYAEATSPLIDGVLTGPVFLKSSNHQLPDLAIALRGPDNQPVEVEFAGRIDSVHGQIRNTIEGLPDVPVSKFVLKMKGGKKGLLVNSRNLCAGKPGRTTVKMTGQNGKLSNSRPKLGNSCGKIKSKHSKKSSRLSRLIVGW